MTPVTYLGKNIVLTEEQERRYREPNKWNICAGNIFGRSSYIEILIFATEGNLSIMDPADFMEFSDFGYKGKSPQFLQEYFSPKNYKLEREHEREEISETFAQYLGLRREILPGEICLGAKFEINETIWTIDHTSQNLGYQACYRATTKTGLLTGTSEELAKKLNQL